MSQGNEYKQHPKHRRGDGEEIDRDNLLRVVMKESLPRLRRRTRALGTVFPDGRVGNVQPQLCQLVGDPRTAPCRVRLPHPSDQSNEFTIDFRPPASPRFPAPKQTEPGAMPADNRCWLDN